MEAINKIGHEMFSSKDLDFLEDLAVQAAIAIENATLYEMAITDGLTGLFVKKYFQQRLLEEYNRAKRYQRELAIVVLDIDFFKKINDNYGHLFGDKVLVKVGEIIRSNCRAVDIPCRYGGEEFVIILPETSTKGARQFAERIRKRIARLVILYKEQRITFSISGGIGSYLEDKPSTGSRLFEFADQALYYSKENGRNRISTLDEVRCPTN